MIILCTLVVVYRLPTSLNQTEDGNKGDQKSSRLRQIDFAGLFMLSATILCLLFVLETLGMKDEKQLVPTWGLAVAFVGSAMAFILTEVFYATRPLIPMNLLLRDLGGYCMMQWLVFSGRTAVWIFHPLAYLYIYDANYINSSSATSSPTSPVSKSTETGLHR